MDYTHTPTAPVRRDWAVLLGQAMRSGKWVIAQVQLVGAVECRVPSPATVLTVGGRWQVSDAHLRAARASLIGYDRDQIMNYLMRADEVVKVEIEGVEQWRTYPPPLHPDEVTAFGHLWKRLKTMDGLSRVTVCRDGTPPDGGGEEIRVSIETLAHTL